MPRGSQRSTYSAPTIASAKLFQVRLIVDTIISPDGFILTKATEVAGQDNLRVAVGSRVLTPRIVGVSAPHDLAMLKVDLGNGPRLKPIAWAQGAVKADVGEWVATSGPTGWASAGGATGEEPIAIGVVSVGMTFVVTGGGIDLSVGAIVALSSVWATTLATQGMANDSHWLVIVFTALVFHPVGYSTELQRVIRDQIYWAQTLLTLALFVVTFTTPFKFRAIDIGAALLAGLFLGWTWLTREEGVWLVPGLTVLMLGGFMTGGARQVLGRMLAVGFAFLVVLGLFRSCNYIAYGSFAGVDVKSSNFNEAMAALQSVQIGKRPYIPVSIEARTAIAHVSPTFAPIAERLAIGSPLLNAWSKPGCNSYPSTCGDVVSGPEWSCPSESPTLTRWRAVTLGR